MSENKFLEKIRGEKAPKSLVEVKNDKFLTPFVGLPKSTDVSHGFQNDAESSVIVANAAKNWGLQKTGLGLLEDASNAVYTGGVNVAGQNAWINLSYTFPTSSDSTNSVVSIINPSSKWVLRLVGKDLFSQNETIGFELVVKIGSTNIANIECSTTRQAGFFCKTFVVDFSDSADKLIKVNGGDKLTVQLFCKDKTATACYYTGSSILSLLERRIDADAVANEKTSFEDIIDGLKTKQDIATAVNYDNITNCITEIPQNVKLEYSGGTFTLKAGSKVYVPNGVDKFDVIDIKSDISITFTSSRKCFLYYYNGGLNFTDAIQNCVSGDTDPLAGQQWHTWYDTANNVIKRYTSDATTPTYTGISLPLALITISSSGTTIDQVFNGFGYIGSHVFVLPGVKGLISNGYNDDGTLHNGILRMTKPVVSLVNSGVLGCGQYNTFGARPNYYIVDTYADMVEKNLAGFYYIKRNNGCYSWGGGSAEKYFGFIPCGTVKVTDGKVQSIDINRAFRAVDYSDTEFIAHQAMPSDRYVDLTLPASGGTITAPADGYIVLSKIATSAGQYIAISNGSVGKIRIYSSGNNQELQATLPIPKGKICGLVYTADGNTQNFRFAYAHGAK